MTGRTGYSYSECHDFQADHTSTVKDILLSLAHEIVTVREATEHQDTKEATDYEVVTVSGSAIAVRIRRHKTSKGKVMWWRDLTLRQRLPTGHQTEEEKILSGYDDWYLYCWCDANGDIGEWIFVDLAALRAQWDVLLRQSIIKQNVVGTLSDFRCIPAKVLDARGCLVRWHRPNRPVRPLAVVERPDSCQGDLW